MRGETGGTDLPLDKISDRPQISVILRNRYHIDYRTVKSNIRDISKANVHYFRIFSYYFYIRVCLFIGVIHCHTYCILPFLPRWLHFVFRIVRRILRTDKEYSNYCGFQSKSLISAHLRLSVLGLAVLVQCTCIYN